MKKRSPQYPQETLLDTRNFVVNVYEKAGDSMPLKYPDLSKFGQVAIRNADTFAATAKMYGWMAIERGKGYRPVASICTILRKPQGDEEKQAYLNAFSQPEIYGSIISDYQGKEIPVEGLEIYLIRNHHFTDSGAKQCVKVFLENAKFLGLINESGIFNSNGEVTITPPTERLHKNKKEQPTAKPTNKASKPMQPLNVGASNGTPSSGQVGKTIMVFIKGQEYNWPVPNSMTSTDWDHLVKQIQQLKQFAT